MPSNRGDGLRVVSGCIMTVTALSCAYVTIWRYDIVQNRQYVPLGRWCFSKTPFVAGSLLLIALFAGSETMQSLAEGVSIALPDSITSTKKTDLSASFFSAILGGPWETVTGITSGMGGFSSDNQGLVLAVLEALNMAALVYVAVFIFYLWGIFAATSAHSVKVLGEGQYNSMWIPIRHAFAFSFTAPVMGGLSAMQIVLIGAIAYGINFANVVWDTSAKYIVDHGNIGIVTSMPPILEVEAKNLVPMLFKVAVIQEIYKNKADAYPSLKDRGTPSVGSTEKVERATADYYAISDTSKNTITLYFRSVDNITPRAMGELTIPGSGGQGEALKSKFATSRLDAILAMYGKLQEAAAVYVNEYTTSHSEIKNSTNATELLQVYRQNLSQALQELLEESTSKPKIKEMIRNSLDYQNGGSPMGWVTAGLFTFSIAKMQQQVDDIVLSTIGISWGIVNNDSSLLGGVASAKGDSVSKASLTAR